MWSVIVVLFLPLYSLGKPLINIQQYKELKHLDAMEAESVEQEKIIGEPQNPFCCTSLLTQYNPLMLKDWLIVVCFK